MPEFIQQLLNFISPEYVQAHTVMCTGGCEVLRALLISFGIFFTLLTGFAYTTVLERRLLAFFQDRIGPNRAGPLGLLQPVADGIKLIFKEDVIPAGADRAVYVIAPIIKTIPALLVVGTIPLGPPLMIPWFDGNWYRVSLALADVNIGVLYILAWLSLGTYGIVLAGWSSNNKYSMLGGLRASAQMLSYELSLGLTMAVPIMITGSMSLFTIAQAQNNPPILGWFVFQNPIAAIILLIALLAEVNRAPFDLPEAESELTAGYHTEYSGMKFALFFMAEYISMISVSMIAISLFFGGYHFLFVDQVPILGPVVYIVKVIIMLSLMIWVRATLPRIRYDRLMAFGWKVMLPVALVAVSWTAVALVVGDAFNSQTAYLVTSVVFLAIILIGGAIIWRPKVETRGDVIALQQRGVGYLLLNIVGGLLSIPFRLFGFLGNVVRNLAPRN
jgi:NADH-quinone oxidoreductase subunit H